jgi:hypothetical protein
MSTQAVTTTTGGFPMPDPIALIRQSDKADSTERQCDQAVCPHLDAGDPLPSDLLADLVLFCACTLRTATHPHT